MHDFVHSSVHWFNYLHSLPHLHYFAKRNYDLNRAIVKAIDAKPLESASVPDSDSVDHVADPQNPKTIE